MPGHRANFAFVESIVQVRPIHETWLCFDNPKILSLEAAHGVVADAVLVGIKMPGGDVIVPSNEREGTRYRVVIEAIEGVAHEIAGDELARIGKRADGTDLILLIARPGKGDEAFPIQHEAGIVRDVGDRDFSPIVVGFAPVGGRPLLIEKVERFVPGFKPIAELVPGVVVEGHLRVAVLVVNLPADDIGVVAVAPSHLGCNTPAEFAIARGGDGDRKSTRLNSSHGYISYAVFCLKKKRT